MEMKLRLIHTCTSGFGHHNMFQAEVREISATKKIVLDALRKGH